MAASSSSLDEGYSPSVATRLASSLSPEHSFDVSSGYARHVATLCLVTVCILLLGLVVYWIFIIAQRFVDKPAPIVALERDATSNTEDSPRSTEEVSSSNTTTNKEIASACWSAKLFTGLFREISSWSANTVALEVTQLVCLALLLVCAVACYLGYQHLTSAVHTTHQGVLDASSILTGLNTDAGMLVQYGDQVSTLLNQASQSCPYIDTSGSGISAGIQDYQDSVQDIYDYTSSLAKYVTFPEPYFQYYYAHAYGAIVALIVLLLVPAVGTYGVHRYCKYTHFQASNTLVKHGSTSSTNSSSTTSTPCTPAAATATSVSPIIFLAMGLSLVYIFVVCVLGVTMLAVIPTGDVCMAPSQHLVHAVAQLTGSHTSTSTSPSMLYADCTRRLGLLSGGGTGDLAVNMTTYYASCPSGQRSPLSAQLDRGYGLLSAFSQQIALVNFLPGCGNNRAILDLGVVMGNINDTLNSIGHRVQCDNQGYHANATDAGRAISLIPSQAHSPTPSIHEIYASIVYEGVCSQGVEGLFILWISSLCGAICLLVFIATSQLLHPIQTTCKHPPSPPRSYAAISLDEEDGLGRNRGVLETAKENHLLPALPSLYPNRPSPLTPYTKRGWRSMSAEAKDGSEEGGVLVEVDLADHRDVRPYFLSPAKPLHHDAV